MFDLFVSDIERALREIGVGDTVVPKRKKKMVRSFYGQIEDFENALDTKDIKALEEGVGKRYFTDLSVNEAAHGKLAHYMLDLTEALGEMDFDAFSNGRFVWPDFSSEQTA